MAFGWPNVECWIVSFENYMGSGLQGIWSSIAKKFYIFVIFQGGGVRTPCPPSGSAHGTGQCIHLLRYTENLFYRAHRLLYDTLHTFYRMHKFLNWRNILEFHSGLIWIQTVFANVNRDRKGEAHGAAVAWKSGVPFGIILHCSPEQFVTLGMAFFLF